MEPTPEQVTAGTPVDYSNVAFEDLPPEEVNRRMRLIGRRRAKLHSKDSVRPIGQTNYTFNPEWLLDPAERVCLHLARITTLLTTVFQDASLTTIARAAPSAPQYVTLDQAAAWVKLNKKTLQRALNTDPNAPDPDVEGGGGKCSYWKWDRIRPWLEQRYGRELQQLLPTDPLR